MGETANIIFFYFLAVVITASSILAVTTRKMLRAATFLLFALIAISGLYLMLDYHFLAVVQLSIYAGGILILFIFAILLTSSKGDRHESHDGRKVLSGIITAVAGIAITTWATIKHKFLFSGNPITPGDHEIDIKAIGMALMSTGKHGYLLPLEIMSVLLLACIIGGILIARKR